MSESTLYGPQQSRFARYLERREQRRPDLIAQEIRRRVLAGLAGEVIEVGSGDGRSFEHYPPEVQRLLAVEPDPAARASAAPRAEAVPFPIEIVEGDAAALPADDATYDAAVVMGLLCSVPDPVGALGELRRVLKPGGELRFWEHIRSGNAASAGCSGASTGCSGRARSAAARRRATPSPPSTRPASRPIGWSTAFTRRRSSRSRPPRT